MLRVGKFCVALAGLLALPGCTSLTTYNRSRPLDWQQPQVAYVDAKQRAIFSIPVRDERGDLVLKVCAEPSPDALSAFAAAGNAGLSIADKAKVEAAASLAESASSIGLRTQSIQLMRDSMYRLCEGVASGTISNRQFETMFRHFQNSMVTILAIEQLTGAIKAADVQIATNASTKPQAVSDTLTDNRIKAKAASDDAVSKAATAKDALTKATTAASDYLKANGSASEDALTEDKKSGYAPLKQAVADATTSKMTADSNSASAKNLLDAYDATLTNLHNVELLTGGKISTGAEPSPSTGQAAVAVAVQNVVLQQLNTGFFRETCATLYSAEIDGQSKVNPGSELHKNCDTFAKNTATYAPMSLQTAAEAMRVATAAPAPLNVGNGNGFAGMLLDGFLSPEASANLHKFFRQHQTPPKKPVKKSVRPKK